MCLKKYLRDQTRHEDNWQELLACCCFPYVRAIMTRVELVRPPAFYLEELKTLVEEVLPHYDLLYGSPDDREREQYCIEFANGCWSSHWLWGRLIGKFLVLYLLGMKRKESAHCGKIDASSLFNQHFSQELHFN
ncbi:uncharacterized protein LOC144752260 isoform X1 [Lissotriton helveticus]